MANALTRFGQRCRDLRSHHNKSIGDQADAFGCQPYEISAIETGRSALPPRYTEKFVDWLALSDQERRELMKRGESNVVAFPRTRAGSHSTSMRLFRRISNMNPSDIRSIKKKPPS